MRGASGSAAMSMTTDMRVAAARRAGKHHLAVLVLVDWPSLATSTGVHACRAARRRHCAGDDKRGNGRND
jgi:hypothetical protein